MKLCFCRALLAAGIIVVMIFWFPAMWVKWAVIAAAAILFIFSLFYQKCFCSGKK